MFEKTPTITQLVGRWLDTPDIAETITAVRRVEPSEGTYAPFPGCLHGTLTAALRASGIEQVYSHQAAAIESACAGQHTVLVTPTASGKSLCFHAPVLSDLLHNPHGRALFLYPTKALTQDQYSGLHETIERTGADIRTFTFDGDTPADARLQVRELGQIVLTNPDMLHAGILPHHTKWLKLFRNLRWVVLDELHAYKGVFGSHLANVIRRLKRIAAFHGSNPTFIAASATIANPREHAERLLEEKVTIIDRSGAPRSSRDVVFVNPPVVNKQLGIRASYLHVARRFASDLVRQGVPTITFVQSRLNVELLVKYLREDLVRNHQDPEIVQGYRGGYLPTHRRRIEQGLRSGAVLGVVATNALELGIDIGDLTACIIAGYPGSIASVWQQAGRAGRRHGESLAVYVARSLALDQYVVQNPDYFFGQTPEEARIDPDNLVIVVDHVKCAAFELPFTEGERYGHLAVEQTTEVLDHLAAHRILHKAGPQWHWMDRSYPANHVSLRSVESENFTVIELDPKDGRAPLGQNRIIAEVDFKSAHTTLHEHAIYNLDGDQYQVERLDYDNHKAFVRRVDPDYFTYAHSKLKITVIAEDGQLGGGADDVNASGRQATIAHGEVLVSDKVVGFKKVRFDTHENVGYGEVFLPEIEMHTSAMWLTVPEAVLSAFGRDRVVDALRGVGQALHTVSVLRMMCASMDLGQAVDDVEESGPRLYLYDNLPGGVGFAPRLFELALPLLASARSLITDCGCNDGCPSCLGAARNPDDGGKLTPVSLIAAILKDAGAPLPDRGTLH